MQELPDYQQVSQAVSLSIHQEASHPTSKQAKQPASFSGATGTGPSNATKQRAPVLHHFPSERPSRLQSLITRLCQSAAHKASTPAASLALSVTACSHYITPLYKPPSAGEGFYFTCKKKGYCIKKLLKPMKEIFLRNDLQQKQKKNLNLIKIMFKYEYTVFLKTAICHHGT